MPALLVVGTFTVAARAAEPLPADVQAEVEHLATCAAYFFNATNAASMREYEALYGAGERARNRALRYLDLAAFDRLMGDAAVAMTALTGGDWRQFHRVRARYEPGCAALALDAGNAALTGEAE
ncbi:MAG: hypothetical protein AB7Q81_18140 [Gammaproteobacteria bacterium]